MRYAAAVLEARVLPAFPFRAAVVVRADREAVPQGEALESGIVVAGVDLVLGHGLAPSADQDGPPLKLAPLRDHAGSVRGFRWDYSSVRSLDPDSSAWLPVGLAA